MKGKNKPISLASISLLLISILLVVTYKPLASGSSSPQHTATVSPLTTTLPEVTYTFNVTCKAASINKTSIILPSGFTNITAQALNDTGNWAVTWVSSTNSYNFSIAAGSSVPNLAAGNWTRFKVIVRWPAFPPTTAKFGVDAFSETTKSANNTVWLTVAINPQFSATITPSLVKGSTGYNFNVTVKNLASSTGLGTINITYPSGWSFNAIVNYGGSRPWSAVHDETRGTFKLWGPNLLIGEAVWILVNMTTQSSKADPANWTATAWDISGVLLGTRNLPVTVDGAAPTVTINQPQSGVYYTVGAGKKIWINGTVSDDLNITKYGLTLTINDTRFERVVYAKGVDHNHYNFAFANKTAIPDGKLAIKITAIDASGRTNSTERTATIDNTAPKEVYVEVLDQRGNKLPYVSDVYWMGVDTTGIRVNASFSNPATPITGKVYLNATPYDVSDGSSILAPDTGSFNVTGSDYVLLKITLVDSAQPRANNFTRTWEIKRDKVKPSAPTFTVQPICGGAIIRALTATDNVGVLRYNVYINGTLEANVLVTSLQASTLTPIGDHRTFSGILVLSLAGYAGKTANITITAVDYGANEGPGLSRVISVPIGLWRPIVLQKDWNLISLPLVPANSSISSVLSLLLKEGLLESVWTYDAETGTWHSYSPGAPPDLTTMVDGKGYFLKMKAYNVLIVQGTEQPAPPATPRVYHVVPGWNLIGYKRLDEVNASTYLSGVDWIRLYKFDATSQTYEYVLPGGNMAPGLGYWVAVKTEGWIYP